MPRFERRGFGGRGRGFGGSSRGFGGPRDDVPKPVQAGEEYDVEISEVGSRGDGIARVKNFVVFINGAKQGEKCRVKIKEVRNRFAIGEKVGEGSSAEETVEEEAGTEEAEETKEEKVAEAEEEQEE